MKWLDRIILVLAAVGGLITAVNVRGLQSEMKALKNRVITLEADQGTIIGLVLEEHHK